ncbi:hypothetical protein SAMN00808754_1971 [Thermanaeromonas toyohensis ToBE]|uniref:Uncharacterized protein n=1 Tax=Thermanaeromonas toyohensis ToBE TaxID=698762 RepID=A0A1W1VWT2_9FIRM|nr:hypothetical protein [Thermanaeromonas toyohensis]SMB97829.1 hypothetical protein SAMN00808754_1971 [Thermanaeromonas toyohensis ToBE]
MEEKKNAALPSSVNTSLSIIDNINVQLVQQTMQKIASFQAVVKSTLREGHDYGVIPGTGSKPTLLKPGAEKILMLLGLTSEYELIEKITDYEKGFFAFTVKCVIYRNGQKITEGMGHANTREKRYTSGKQQDPYTLANTVLKMAKKRAQVDAVLTVASLSEIFTQDLEDELEELEATGYVQTQSQPSMAAPRNREKSNGQGGRPDWTAFWKAVKGELKLKEKDVEELASQYFGTEVKVAKLSTRIRTQQELNQLFEFLKGAKSVLDMEQSSETEAEQMSLASQPQ